MSYRVSTQVYSGPFDLLLQLVTRQKVDIGAISISEVAEQYLAEAERIEALQAHASAVAEHTLGTVLEQVLALYALDYLVIRRALRAKVRDDAKLSKKELLTSERPPPAVLGVATKSSSACDT